MIALAEAFDGPLGITLDVTRLLLGGLGIALAGYQVRMIALSTMSGQRARFVGIGLGLLVVALSRVQNIGAPITWQFWAGLVMFGCLAYGTWSFARREAPAQRRAVGDPSPPPAPSRLYRPDADPPPGRHGAQ